MQPALRESLFYQWFCMVSVCALFVFVFAFSSLGFVLSLRDVELRARSRCPEVALDIFSLTF